MTDDEKHLAVIDRMIDLELSLRRLLEIHGGPCRLDGMGYCFTHGFRVPCAVAVARALLAGAEVPT
jgi:hypothetical protein